MIEPYRTTHVRLAVKLVGLGVVVVVVVVVHVHSYVRCSCFSFFANKHVWS